MTRTDDPAQWDSWEFAPGPQPARPSATPTRQRSGPTPEAKVSAKISAYLKSLAPRPITIRTNAGLFVSETGHTVLGAKAGTSDLTCCFAGQFVAIEVKATTAQSEAQQRYQARVEALGGLYILARSVDDVRRALAERFGAETVKRWEGK